MLQYFYHLEKFEDLLPQWQRTGIFKLFEFSRKTCRIFTNNTHMLHVTLSYKEEIYEDPLPSSAGTYIFKLFHITILFLSLPFLMDNILI